MGEAGRVILNGRRFVLNDDSGPGRAAYMDSEDSGEDRRSPYRGPFQEDGEEKEELPQRDMVLKDRPNRTDEVLDGLTLTESTDPVLVFVPVDEPRYLESALFELTILRPLNVHWLPMSGGGRYQMSTGPASHAVVWRHAGAATRFMGQSWTIPLHVPVMVDKETILPPEPGYPENMDYLLVAPEVDTILDAPNEVEERAPFEGLPDDLVRPDEDPLVSGLIQRKRFENRVMAAYGQAAQEVIRDVVEGIPSAISILLDLTPIVGDLKGIGEAIRGKDLITDEELGWVSRGLGLVCLSEIRNLSRGGKAAGLVNKTEKFVALNELAKTGGKEDVGKALGKLLTEDAQLVDEARRDVRRQRFAMNKIAGKDAEEGAGKALSDLANKKKGILRAQVPKKSGQMAVRYDYVLTRKAQRFIWEVKGIQWDKVTYEKRWRVSSRLNQIAEQVRNQRNVAGSKLPHEVWFWNKPVHDWQMEMILQWAKDSGIVITFDKPTILK